MKNEKITEWLLDSDPSIRWQVMRDLLDSKQEIIASERNKIATEGWGSRLLSYQDSSGQWGGQLYNNKWLSTTYTLLLLRHMGLDPANQQAHLACKALLDSGFQPSGGINYAKTVESIDNGVTGMILSLLSYFGYPDHRVHTIAEYLVSQQMADGRWEPFIGNNNLKYTFDGTMLILDGLQAYEKQFPLKAERSAKAQMKGREFLFATNYSNLRKVMMS